MPEWRRDAASGRWVIISAQRADRPNDLPVARGHVGIVVNRDSEIANCPFCPGNEFQTPPELDAIPAAGERKEANSQGWEVRCFPNKFPALEVGPADYQSHALPWPATAEGFYLATHGYGAHDIIVESPEHADDLETMPLDRLAKVLIMYWRRFRVLSDSGDWQYVALFRNSGRGAGASLAHPHSQLLALPFIPPTVAEEVAGARAFYHQHGRCVYCQLLDTEIKREERAVTENDDFLAFVPFAARMPYEVWITPKKHAACFSDVCEEELPSLAEVLAKVLRCLTDVLGPHDYNLVVHSLSLRSDEQSSYHWHVEVLPRTTVMAGLELGAGVHINPVVPEEAARRLRDASRRRASGEG